MTTVGRLLTRNAQKLGRGLAFLAAASLPFAAITRSQDDGGRQIVLEEFTKARPAATSTKATGPSGSGNKIRKPVSAKGPRYVRKTPAVLVALKANAEVMEIGVTIWRLRPGVGNDGGARVLVMEEARPTEWTPQRIEADTPLKVGERVRLSIESPRAGYLYVIDREQYADGSYGDAYLIFPTLRTRGGDNRVRPGKLIDIPAQEDNPSYFTLVPSPSRSDQVAEILSIIVTPEPLENLRLSDRPLKLSKSDVARWEASGSVEVERYEMVGGAGMSWSKVEMEASAAGSARILTQEEPTPQTVYRIGSKSKGTFMITVPLRYGR